MSPFNQLNIEPSMLIKYFICINAVNEKVKNKKIDHKNICLVGVSFNAYQVGNILIYLSLSRKKDQGSKAPTTSPFPQLTSESSTYSKHFICIP